MKHIILIAFFLLNFHLFSQAVGAESVTIDSLKKVVSDKEKSLQEKSEMLVAFTDYSFYDDLVPVCQQLIEQAKQEKNYSVLLQTYGCLVLMNCGSHNFDKALESLNLALGIEDKLKDQKDLYTLCDVAGIYYDHVNELEKSHEYFYRAIEYAEQIGGKEEDIIYYLDNMSKGYLAVNDLLSVKNNLDKMEEYRKRIDSPLSDLRTYRMACRYYYTSYMYTLYTQMETGEVREEDTQQMEINRDFFEQYVDKIIALYNNTEKKSDMLNWNNSLIEAYLYRFMMQTKLQQPDYTKLLKEMDEVQLFFKDLKVSMEHRMNFIQCKIYVYVSSKQYKKAIEAGLSGLALLDETIKETPELAPNLYTSYANFNGLIADSYKELNDYKNAYEYAGIAYQYEKKKYENTRYNTVKELETRYEVKAKELAIENLQKENKLNKRIRYLAFGVAVLLCAVLLVVILLTRVRRKAMQKDLEMLRIKEEESRLQMHIKEEEAQLAELEKYQALSEVHLKELEIYGKDSELNQLKKEKESLDKEIKAYSEKLQSYEREIEVENTNCKRNLATPIVEELTSLIEKRIENFEDREIYLAKLSQVSDLFISKIKKSSNEPLSLTYLKYCICFSIGMNVKDSTACFSVEASSIHMIRYRLKKRFGLGSKDDLDVYLGNLLKTNSEVATGYI